MSFELVAYERLKLSLIEAVNSLIRERNPSAVINTENLEVSVMELPSPERRVQATLLLRAVARLDALPDMPERARTLNALAFFIRDKIASGYKYSSPERSLFHRLLTTSLALTKENEPSDSDLLGMYEALKNFVCQHVYNDGQPRRGYLTEQIFAIEGFSVEGDICKLNMTIADLANKEIMAAQKLQESLARPAKGILSSATLFGGKGAAASAASAQPEAPGAGLF